MFFDRFNGSWAALSFTNHAHDADLFQHHVGKLIHTS
ncbi:Uncharacterised protein [Vibrio cholerae]|nr:Uncharacterised protein [Vibrio cholerae]